MKPGKRKPVFFLTVKIWNLIETCNLALRKVLNSKTRLQNFYGFFFDHKVMY